MILLMVIISYCIINYCWLLCYITTIGDYSIINYC
jgi:hypothetical protein